MISQQTYTQCTVSNRGGILTNLHTLYSIRRVDFSTNLHTHCTVSGALTSQQTYTQCTVSNRGSILTNLHTLYSIRSNKPTHTVQYQIAVTSQQTYTHCTVLDAVTSLKTYTRCTVSDRGDILTNLHTLYSIRSWWHLNKPTHSVPYQIVVTF